MKNKLTDLNNHLFAQLERLSDEGLEGEKLKAEIDRSKAVAGLAKEVVSNASLVLEGKKYIDEHSLQPDRKLPGVFNDAPKLVSSQ